MNKTAFRPLDTSVCAPNRVVNGRSECGYDGGFGRAMTLPAPLKPSCGLHGASRPEALPCLPNTTIQDRDECVYGTAAYR